MKLGANDLEPINIAVAWAVQIALVTAIVVLDERRLSPEKLARAWPPASSMSAIFFFTEIALFLHFARTRRSVTGVLLGIATTAFVVLLANVVCGVVDLEIGDCRFVDFDVDCTP
jgi:hypothetical protein